MIFVYADYVPRVLAQLIFVNVLNDVTQIQNVVLKYDRFLEITICNLQI